MLWKLFNVVRCWDVYMRESMSLDVPLFIGLRMSYGCPWCKGSNWERILKELGNIIPHVRSATDVMALYVV